MFIQKEKSKLLLHLQGAAWRVHRRLKSQPGEGDQLPASSNFSRHLLQREQVDYIPSKEGYSLYLFCKQIQYSTFRPQLRMR